MELLNNSYIQFILALSTILGGIAAYKQLFLVHKKKENEKTLIKDNGKSNVSAIIDASQYFSSLNKVETYNLAKIRKIDHDYIKSYICQILNNTPVGKDEFERNTCSDNIEKLKREIKSEVFNLNSNIIFGLDEYDFNKNGFKIILHYADYNYDMMNISISDESNIKKSIFIGIKDLESAKKWKDKFIKENNHLVLQDDEYCRNNVPKPEFIDKADILVQVENCRLNTT